MNRNDFYPMNAAGLMDSVFEVYKKSFAKQLLFSALVGVLSFIAMFVLGIIAAFAVAIPMINNIDNSFYLMLFAVLAAMLPVYWIWTSTADAGHILLSKQAFYGEKLTYPFRPLFKTIFRVLGATLAQILLSIPWLLVLLGIVLLASNPADSLYAGDTTFLLSFLSSNFYIILTIVSAVVYVAYSNLFALAVPVAVFENKTFFKAISRSYTLLKGEFWKILGIRLLWVLVSYLFSYSAQGLWYLLMALVSVLTESALGSSAALWMTGNILQSLFSVVIGFVMGPLTGIMTALIYFNQRIKREALDIEIGLDQLSNRLTGNH